jgi:glycine dehydrogenase subunit 1
MEAVLSTLEDEDILGGLPVDGGVLWCATEKASKAALDKTISVVKEVLAK